MKTYREILLTLVCAFFALGATAQSYGEPVELLLIDGSTAIFSSEGSGSDKKAAIENAKSNLIRKIMFDGVEDFNDSYPIARSRLNSNAWLKGLCDEKNPGYTTFVGPVEVVGDFDRSPTGETHCRTNIMIKYKMLIQYAETQGVTQLEGMEEAPAPTPRPTQPKKKTKQSFF